VLLGLPAASGARLAANDCPMSHVHYAPYPGVGPGLGDVPWISSGSDGRFKAHLFFYDPTRLPGRRSGCSALVSFTTRKSRLINPDVLWIPRTKGYGRTLTKFSFRPQAHDIRQSPPR